MKKEGGEGSLRQKEQLGEGIKAGKDRTDTGNGEEMLKARWQRLKVSLSLSFIL